MSGKGHAFELIPLSIEAKGEVIASNVDEFRELVRGALGAINLEPKTDEEFGQAEIDVKALKGAEDSVKSAKEKALKDAEDLHQLFAALDETSEEIRQARLELEKTIKTKKEEVRNRLVLDALDRIDKFDLPAMQRERVFRAELDSAVKGKRTLDSMGKALDVAVKVINGRIGKCRAILDQFEEAHGSEMILDRSELEMKTTDQVEAELRRRIDLKKAEDAKKAAQEEAAKAKAEAAAAKEEAQGKTTLADVEDAPPAPPAAMPPVASEGPSAGAEWAGFEAAVMLAFKPLKEAKDRLKHPENIEKAKAFAMAVNAAWKEAKAGKEVAA